MPHIFGNIFAVYLNTWGGGGQTRPVTLYFFSPNRSYFFPKLKKISPPFMKQPSLFFLLNLPMVFIYKFCKKKFNSTTRKTSKTSSRSNSTKTGPATQNFTKDKMTGSRRVDILCCFFAKSSTNVKMKSKERKSGVFGKLCFFGSLDFFYVIFCSSRFYNSFFF